MSEPIVGFIGLDFMGTLLAQNLIKGGNRLVVYDQQPEAMTSLTSSGAVKAVSPAEVALKCNRIITMLPNSAQVLQIYSEANGILSAVKSGSTLINTSTIDEKTVKQLALSCQDKGVVYLDAPVSSFTFMVGSTAEQFRAMQIKIYCYAWNAFHCGPVGTGVSAKICSNMMLGISMVGTSETLNLAQKLGLDPKIMTQILNCTSARNWCTESYNPVPGVGDNLPANKDYEGGFATSLMAKDLSLAQSAATQANCPTPLGTLCHQLYRLMLNNGYSEKDFSSVYKFLLDFNEK